MSHIVHVAAALALTFVPYVIDVEAVSSATESTALATPLYTVTDLGTLGGTLSAAEDINNHSQVVGWADPAGPGLRRTVLWEDGHLTDLGSALPAGWSFLPSAINDSSQIAGRGVTPSTAVFEMRPLLWEEGVITDLGTLPGGGGPPLAPPAAAAAGVNEASQIVGWSRPADGHGHAALWENGVATDLGSLPSGYATTANAINDAGQVLGYVWMPGDPFRERHAVIWEHGTILELSGLPAELTFYEINDINEAGQVVGTVTAKGALSCSPCRAFLWDDSHFTLLKGLGEGNAFATAINDSGEIVGRARTADDDESHAVRWDPNSEDPVGGGDAISGGSPIARRPEEGGDTLL